MLCHVSTWPLVAHVISPTQSDQNEVQIKCYCSNNKHVSKRLAEGCAVNETMNWIGAAFLAAFFAGITSILAKCGVRDTDSDIATGIRTAVVLVFAWVVVFVVGSANQIGLITPSSWFFLLASGAATGASWICYFKALSLGDVNKVVPVDKSSTILAALFAIVLFGETSNLVIKLVSIGLIALGTYMMIERRTAQTSTAQQDTTQPDSASAQSLHPQHQSHGWLWYALAAAIFAALTSILAKYGIEGIDSNLATAIRTCVVLVMAWGIVAARGKLKLVSHVLPSEALFLVASGIATGASWLFFYYAIQTGQVSIVVQIDKLSLVVSIAFAWIFLHEKLSRKAGIGLVLIVVGTAFMTAFP